MVCLDRVLEIVNVDELDVKLILEMLYVLELVFAEGVAGYVLEFDFVFCEFFAVAAECFSPGIALGGELGDFNLNHG
jgi:hypothetical protein